MRMLVVVGAGFIGSPMTKMLLEENHEAVVYDNLSCGHSSAVLGAELVIGNLADLRLLDALLAARRFDAVMHFASFSQVGESVLHPEQYYRNNVAGTAFLLEMMAQHGVSRLVYSSSAAVFGEPAYVPIDERHPKHPVNPYGNSKLLVEELLAANERASGLGYVCLRYFNAAGADPGGALGECHNPETHLIPLALQAASGRRTGVEVFGTDYDTHDGTCIRDYVHMTDLCQAHLLALDWLCDGRASSAFNLGSEYGFSVREVLDAVVRVTGRSVKVVKAGRRPGDPARLVADAQLAHSALTWSPRYSALDTLIAHAWAWEQRIFNGKLARPITRHSPPVTQ